LGLNIAGLGAGYVGNYLSQLSALEYAFRYEGTDVLIFEDDAVLGRGFEFRFEAAVAELPSDWDCLYLGCVQKSIDEGDRVNERVTLVHSPLLRTAVLHRWESLPKIISLLHPIRESLDGTFCRLAKSELKVYATNPPLVGIHDPTDSDCAP
jgi:GR25 family glycosyltransferase involved in LPS biosynthesis